MRYLATVTTLVLLTSCFASAQVHNSQQHALAEMDAAMASTAKYCHEIRAFENSREPLSFASAGDLLNAGDWRPYQTNIEWERAGKPMPAASAWQKDGRIVAVRLRFIDAGTGVNVADYCFRDDGSLAKLELGVSRAPGWNRPRLHTQVKVARTWFFGPEGNLIGEVQGWQPIPLQSEKTDFIFLQPPLFRNVVQLPFFPLLYSGT